MEGAFTVTITYRFYFVQVDNLNLFFIVVNELDSFTTQEM
jgi:hypothetical protein